MKPFWAFALLCAMAALGIPSECLADKTQNGTKGKVTVRVTAGKYSVTTKYTVEVEAGWQIKDNTAAMQQKAPNGNWLTYATLAPPSSHFIDTGNMAGTRKIYEWSQTSSFPAGYEYRLKDITFNLERIGGVLAEQFLISYSDVVTATP